MRTLSDPHLAEVASWVGGDRLDCWDLVRQAFALRGVDLPRSYITALQDRRFRTVHEPEPWDVVPYTLHTLRIVTHVSLYLGGGHVIHSIEGPGIVIEPLERRWFDQIARDRHDRRGYLRLRT